MDSFVEEKHKTLSTTYTETQGCPTGPGTENVPTKVTRKKQKEQQFWGENVGVYLNSGTPKTSQNDDF